MTRSLHRIRAKPSLPAVLGLALSLLPQPCLGDEQSPRLRQYETAVDRAVELGLMSLAREQPGGAGDGSYSDANGKTNGVVGLAGMAFLAKGYRPGVPPYGDVINRSIDYILNTESSNGYLGVRGGKMYEHAIATLLMSEVSGMVDPARQQRIDIVLPKALKVILDAQANNPTGAWRYEPTSTDADISVTGWNLMALRSARLNGAPVPKDAIDKAVRFIDACRGRGGLRLVDNGRSADDGGFWYTPPQYYANRNYWLGGPSTPSRTGVALLCRELAGHHGDEVNRKAGDYILHNVKARGFLDGGHVEYATYYCAQGMFQLGGDYWETFAAAMYRHLLAEQQQDGSWHSDQGTSYATAMYVLALSVSYRQLPIYQR